MDFTVQCTEVPQLVVKRISAFSRTLKFCDHETYIVTDQKGQFSNNGAVHVAMVIKDKLYQSMFIDSKDSSYKIFSSVVSQGETKDTLYKDFLTQSINRVYAGTPPFSPVNWVKFFIVRRSLFASWSYGKILL